MRIKKYDLKNNRGDGYIDVVVAVLVAMMLIVLALNVFSFLTVKQDMDYFAKEIIEVATANGSTAGDVNQRYYELAYETGISPGYDFSGSEFYNNSRNKVQLGDKIKITMRYSTYVKGFGIFRIPVSMTVVHSGLSEKYWKAT
ncbi:MAG: DUF4320 family protein [Christensenellaceae bacterium]